MTEAKDQPTAPDTPEEAPVSVLFVDDEETFRSFLLEGVALLGHGRYDAIGVQSVDEALALIADRSFDALVTDIRMPDKDGLQLLLELKKRTVTIPTVVMTAYGSPSVHAEAARRGAVRYIEKPFRFEALMALLDDMIEQQSELRERGPLDLIEVLEMLCVGGKDMTVNVRTKDGNGTICVQQGEMVHAEFLGKTGTGALYELVAYRQVQIATNPITDVPQPTITQPWHELSQEAWRRRTNPSHEIASLSEKSSEYDDEGDEGYTAHIASFWFDKRIDEILLAFPQQLPDMEHPEVVSHDDEGGEQLSVIEDAMLMLGTVLDLGSLVGSVVKEKGESWLLVPLGRGRTLTAICPPSSHAEKDLLAFSRKFVSKQEDEDQDEMTHRD